MASNNDAMIAKDRLRFIKNKLSSNLILLAIVANALYFVSIYSTDVGDYYYKIFIGASIVYNLIFMLAAFLCSEGIKNYKMSYACTSIVLAVLQIARIFYIPARAHGTESPVVGAEGTTVMSDGQFGYVTMCLVASALLLAAAGAVGIIKTNTLNSYTAELEAREKEARGNKR